MKDFRKSVIYQIYPKSFKDSNGDGIGDLKGVIEKLDYIKELGVDYIWLTPFYISPQRDNGYDVADYYRIDERFGTMDDFEELVEQSRKRGIDIMLDMVFNHTSTEHKWFQKAMAGDEKYKDYYIFKKGRNGKEPTNWKSKFGGSAWEYVEKFDEYYLHLFDVTQADLNWENENVRNEIFDVVNYWLAKGVKGFRLDVINLISKPSEYNDDFDGDGRRFYTDGPKIHNYLKELNEKTFGKYDDVITVGEMSSTSIENCIKYSNPTENELSMVFNFHHLKVDYENGDKWTLIDFDFNELKNLFDNWQNKMYEGEGCNALFWCNHDQPRVLSRFGNDGVYADKSAKMLATALHMMSGIPYVYQGEEIGMINPKFEDIAEYRDVESLNMFEIKQKEGLDLDEIMQIIKSKSRDNSRTPMQWNLNDHAGFTCGTPWINTAENYKSINAKCVRDNPKSIFYHYQRLIKLRKEKDIIAYGDYKILNKNHEKIYSYVRSYKNSKLLVINNFYEDESIFKLPENIDLAGYKREILISNYDDSEIEFEELNLRPYESIVYYLEK